MVKVAKVNQSPLAVLTSPGGLGGTTPLPALDDLTDVDTTGVTDGDILVWDDGTDTWVVGSASGLPWFVVTAYGAVGDGSTDDTAAINAAIAAYNAAGGGILYFPAVASGDYYYCASALTALTKPGTVLGDGGGSTSGAASPVATDHGTAFLFTVSADNVHFSGLRIVNFTASPSAGAGIRTTTGYGNHCHYDDLWVEGFYDCVSIQYGFEWGMSRCHITNPVRYGLFVANIDLPDGGDWYLSDSWFGTRSRNATSAIRQESGGGGKLTNVKINCNSIADAGTYGGVKRYVTGYDLAISSSTYNTSVLHITGCSIENVSGDGVKIATTSTGSFGAVTIGPLEVGLYSNNSGYAVNLNASSAAAISVILVDGLVAITDGTARAAISLTNTDNVRLGDIVLKGFNARYTSSGDTNTVDDAAVSFATPAIVLGTAAAAGAASTVIRSDSTIVAFDATAPVTQAYSDAAATGSAAVAARRDHRHGMPASGSGIGELLISDTPSTPLVFADLLQNEAQDDLLYADP